MRTIRSLGIASAFLLAGPVLAGCQAGAAADVDPAAGPAVVEAGADGGPSRITLTSEARERIGLETAAVEDGAGGRSLPYAAVVYDAEGGTWAFVEVEPGVYQRQPVEISSVDGNLVLFSEGPEAGADVVTVAAAELVGVEAGISGGE